MKIFRTIIAFFQALLPLLGFSFIGVVIYSELNRPFNIIIAITFLIIGLYLSRFVFNMIRRRGIISVMSGNNATYDLDELEPTPGSGVLKLTPEGLVNLFSENKLTFNQGTTISIWGDWEGRQLDTRHKISALSFNQENNILTINFSDKCVLKIKSPSLIFYSSSYLKVVKAKVILWETPSSSNLNNEYRYFNIGTKIKTESNTKWISHIYDIGVGMNALYLQG